VERETGRAGGRRGTAYCFLNSIVRNADRDWMFGAFVNEIVLLII
jgi:hypothetical protein